jgi:hypothetical protein
MQNKKERLWMNGGLSVQLRTKRPNLVCCYDFANETYDRRAYQILRIIDENNREALMTRVDQKLNSTKVIDALTDFFILLGALECMRSDGGLEFIAQKVHELFDAAVSKTA